MPTNDYNIVSGRWLLAVCSGISFIMLIGIACYALILKINEISGTEIILFTQNLLQIILAVFAWYFTKRRPEPTENENEQQKKPVSELGSNTSSDIISSVPSE